MISTRTSWAMATIILRTVSACASSRDRSNLTRSSLVTPSMMRATLEPNSRSASSTVKSVSSTVSCNRAAAMDSASKP